MPSKYYLVCPSKSLPLFVHQADRDYFAKPVAVELISCNIATRLLTVYDPARGHTYPALPENVYFWARLSKKRLEAAGHFSKT